MKGKSMSENLKFHAVQFNCGYTRSYNGIFSGFSSVKTATLYFSIMIMETYNNRC